MLRRSHLDIYILPLALGCTLTMAFPIWGHHAVLESRGGFTTRHDAETWAADEKRANRCIVQGAETVIGDAGASGLDLTDGHPFSATLKCHHKTIWWKLAATLIGPWLLMTICVRLVGPAKEADH